VTKDPFFCTSDKFFQMKLLIFHRQGKPEFFEEESFVHNPGTKENLIFRKKHRQKGRPDPKKTSPKFSWSKQTATKF